MSQLIPPDLERCQADKPNGNTFMTLGGRPALVRCNNVPVCIATEREAGKDGQKGSMSLCAECWTQMFRQLGAHYADFSPITKP